ncbi:MAG: glutathione S-transferase family protein [Deltaproteobacteria bacterium]|nr:glutathione S-transferase family protein [Deltaproteobacteria bacterium]
MPTLYGVSASPFVRKVRIVLAEKGIAYEHDPVIPVNVSAEYKKISPLGKIPAYKDGDRALADSSVICAYLERAHPQPALYPSDPYEYARALWFEEYGDTALLNVFGPKIFFQRVVQPRFFSQPCDEAIVQKAVAEDLPPLFDYLEGEVGEGGVIAGTRFSIGDIGLATQFINLRFAGFGVDAKRWPKLARYVDHVRARPSIKAIIDEEAPLLGA